MDASDYTESLDYGFCDRCNERFRVSELNDTGAFIYCDHCKEEEEENNENN